MVLSTLRGGLWAVLCLAGAAAAAQGEPVPGSVGFSAVAALPMPSPVATVRYGPAGPQFAELYLPAGSAPAPTVVLVHGGCWLNAYGLDHVRALAGALTAEGYAVWSLEYRRVGDAGGGWPGTGDDVQAAVAALVQAPFTARLDLQRLAVLGHSAGGHLALWLASHWPEALPAPKLTLGLAPITDLPAYAAGDNSCEVATPQFLGGLPATAPAAYAAADPLPKTPGSTAFALIHGAEDPIVAPSQSEAFAQALGRAHRTVTLEILPAHGHFALIHPHSPAFPVLTGVLGEALAP
jgi:acetyl esterase/lipase